MYIYIYLLIDQERFLAEELEYLEKDLLDCKKIMNWLTNINKNMKMEYTKVKFYLKDDKKHFYQLSKNTRKISM